MGRGKSETQIIQYGLVIREALKSISGSFGEKYKEDYRELKEKMETLIRLNELYYKRDEKQASLPLGPEEIKGFQKAYNDVAEILGKIETNIDADSKIKEEDDIKEMISNFQDIVSQDNQLMATIKPGVNLAQAVFEVTDQVIDISEADLGKVGANQSSRIPMTIVSNDGEKIKGFFTEETNFDITQDYRNEIARLKAEFGGESKMLDMIFCGTEEENAKLFYEMIKSRNPKPDGTKPTYYELEKFIYKKYPEYDDSEEFFDSKRKKNKEKDEILDVLCYDLDKMCIPLSMNENGLGLKQGDNLDRRNEAMSSMATMLGVPNLIVKSTQVTLQRNGETIKGTLLQNAEGIDLAKQTESKKEEDFKNTNAYKDLADLQILDYICGNIDRHALNMFYKFDDDGKFIGVQGIDNDCSFGEKIPLEDEHFSKLPAPAEMKLISKSMSESVMALTPNLLKTNLKAFGLSKSQIKATCTRLEVMKSCITSGKLTVVEDDKFKDIDFMNPESTEYAGSYLENGKKFNGMVEMNCLRGALTSKPDMVVHSRVSDDEKPFTQPEVFTVERVKMNALTHTNAYAKPLEDLEKVDPWYIKSSKGFKAIKSSLTTLKALTDIYKDRPMDGRGFEEMTKEFNTFLKESEAYLKRKDAEKKPNENSKLRANAVRAITEIIKEKKKEFIEKAKDYAEKMEYKRKDAARTIDSLVNKVGENKLSDEFAVDIIKKCNAVSKAIAPKTPEADKMAELLTHAGVFLKKQGLIDKVGLSGEDWKKTRENIAKGTKEKMNQIKFKTDSPEKVPGIQ